MPANQEQLKLLFKLLNRSDSPSLENASEEEINEFILKNLTQSQTEMLKNLMSDKTALESFLKNPNVKNIIDNLDL